MTGFVSDNGPKITSKNAEEGSRLWSKGFFFFEEIVVTFFYWKEKMFVKTLYSRFINDVFFVFFNPNKLGDGGITFVQTANQSRFFIPLYL